MTTNLNVAMAPKDSTFQVRINSEIKKAVEEIYAKTGMTLTDAFNTFIQLIQSGFRNLFSIHPTTFIDKLHPLSLCSFIHSKSPFLFQT